MKHSPCGDDWVSLATYDDLQRLYAKALERAQRAEEECAQLRAKITAGLPTVVRAGRERDEARAWALRYGRLYLAAKAERDRLQAALTKHGVHAWACRVVVHKVPEEQCSCGLMAALGYRRPTEEDQ